MLELDPTMMSPSVRRTGAVIIVCGAILGSVVLWRSGTFLVNDFTSFWIAGQRLVAHANPYDAHYALEIEQRMGFQAMRPFVMRNPPWALWITLPLGVLNYAHAWLFWMASLISCLACSAVILWIASAGDRQRTWVAPVLAFLFAPTLACLSVGQTAPIVLLGIALFLWLEAEHEFWAGTVLLAAAFKPQIALLFWIALGLWCFQYRRWKLKAGLVSAMAISAGIAVLFDAHVFTDYRAMLQSASVENQFMPTLGGYLRARLGPAWLQIVPAILGVTGTLIYYACHARRWLWREQMPLLLLASILCAPYAWLLDEVVLLAALIPAAAAVKPSLVRPLGAAFVLANLGILIALAAGFRVVSSYYLWTIWVWMAFYFVSKQIYWKDQVRVS